MRVNAVAIKGFRGIKELNLDFDPGIAVLVGENGAGKSTVGLALYRLFSQGISGHPPISVVDYPYGVVGEPVSITAKLDLLNDEIDQLLVSKLVSSSSDNYKSELSDWLKSRGSTVDLALNQPRSPEVVELSWGDLKFTSKIMTVAEGDPSHTRDWVAVVERPADFNLFEQGGTYKLSADIASDIRSFALDRYKLLEEFPSRTRPDQRTATLESMGGSEVASVLLNLKNHPDSSQRDRHDEIVKTFQRVYPRYEIVAVENPPASGNPDVQFLEAGREQPLLLEQISSGTYQILALIINLIGRSGLIFFLQHPESNLHPQARRLIQSLLARTTERNQIIVATHDPYFVDPANPRGIKRMWWSQEEGTKMWAISQDTDVNKLGQTETILRSLGKREIVFSRAVVVVEDESQELFLSAVAPVLGRDIDANAVSVVPVFNGESGFRPFLSGLSVLGIPHLALKDLPWGDDIRYPPDRYFSLGCELEDYLDQNGLDQQRQQVIEDVGNGKPRVAAELGARLKREEVPELFDQLLEKAISLANSEHHI